MTITLPALIEILEQRAGTKACSVVTVTSPKVNKKHRETGAPCPFKNVTRLAQRSIMLGANYEAKVNRHRDAEDVTPDFQAEALWKGAGQKHSLYTVSHKGTGKVYFAYLPSQSEGELIAHPHSEWFADGVPMTDAQIAELKHFLPPLGDAPKQEIEAQVFWRTLDLSNLIELRWGGEVYNVDHSVPATVEYIASR